MLSGIALHKKLDECAVLRSALRRAAAFKTLDLLTSACINCVVSMRQMKFNCSPA